jgi:hypothetical protein
MSKEIVNKPGAAMVLSADMADALVSGIAESRSTTQIAGGVPLMRLLKSGDWVFGQNDEPVQEGSEWAINPLSIMHGYSCWSDRPGKEKNELLGSEMVSITQRKPAKPEPIEGFPFNEQRQFGLKCLNGDDEGVEVLYRTSSVGGMRAVDGLLAALVAQIKVDRSKPVPVVQLNSDSYKHSKWGPISTPVFEIVDWIGLDGEPEPDEEEEEEEAAPPPPAKAARPRAAKAPAPVAAAPWEEEDEIDTTPQPDPKPAARNGKASLKAPPVEEEMTRAAVPPRASAPPRRQRPAERA